MIVAILPEKKREKEKPTNLGAKVYRRHRVMLRKLARHETKTEGRKVSMNEVLRTAIEQIHDRRFNNNTLLHNNEFKHPKS